MTTPAGLRALADRVCAEDGGADFDQLEALARAATPGEWEHKQPFETVSRQRTIHGTVPAQRVDYVAANGKVVIPMEGRENTALSADMAYIAAANPAVILALIERVRVAEAALADVREYTAIFNSVTGKGPTS